MNFGNVRIADCITATIIFVASLVVGNVYAQQATEIDQQAKTIESTESKPNATKEPEAKKIKPEPEADKKSDPGISEDQMRLYQSECDARRRKGLSPRILDAALCRLAQIRANAIVRRFGHFNVPSGAAEVIAQNNTGAPDAVKQWDRSSGHNRLMFGGRLVGGYGVAWNGGKCYCVALYRSTSIDKPVTSTTTEGKPSTVVYRRVCENGVCRLVPIEGGSTSVTDSNCANGQCGTSTRTTTTRRGISFPRIRFRFFRR